MCTAAYVNDKKCWSCGELRDAMGTPIIVSVYEGLPPVELEEQDCLCNVDIEAMAAASGATWERDEIGDYVITIPTAACLDCGIPYGSMGLDMVLPDQQWRILCPENGILCPSCICKRAAQLGGTCVMAWVDNVDYSKPYKAGT